MASISASSGTSYGTLTATATATRNGTTVTVNISYTLTGQAYYALVKVAGTTIYEATDVNVPSINRSGTITKTYYNVYEAQSYSFALVLNVQARNYSPDNKSGTVTSNTVAAAQFTVTFNDNYTGGSTSTKTETYGSTWVFPTDPTRTGYSFTGWNTAADGTGTSYSVWDTVAITANTTLYAQWDAQSILHIVENGTPETITEMYAVESGTPTRIVGVYAVVNGEVYQGV